MNDLTTQDYIKILEYYKINVPKSNRLIKLNAEKILRDKLCRCIKKLDPINEGRSIGICTKSVINRKGLSRGKFNCTGKRRNLVLKKQIKNKTRKLRSS
jgi:hypothetical protein